MINLQTIHPILVELKIDQDPHGGIFILSYLLQTNVISEVTLRCAVDAAAATAAAINATNYDPILRGNDQVVAVQKTCPSNVTPGEKVEGTIVPTTNHLAKKDDTIRNSTEAKSQKESSFQNRQEEIISASKHAISSSALEAATTVTSTLTYPTKKMDSTFSYRATENDRRRALSTNESNASLVAQSTLRTRHIALHIYYDGGLYSGLAENVGQASDRSIERALFSALKQAHLITSRDTCQYSRCGRTDRGVSALGQIIAMQIKSAFPFEATIHDPTTTTDLCNIDNTNLPKNSLDKLNVWVPRRKKIVNSTTTSSASSEQWIQKSLSEYAYDKILNNLLPPDIRVLGWCPVSDEFSARFSCVSRSYRYFFVVPKAIIVGTPSVSKPSPLLSLDRMRQGLQYMVGTHDFRNFCKMDVEKVYNFVRTIHLAEIIVTSSMNNHDVCYLHIVGQAFLWHQIRCIVHVLFLIGRGLEEPTIVQNLLNIDQNPGKPSYPLADERPLVLHECLYYNLSFGYSITNLWNVVCQQEQQWEDHVLAAARIRNCIDSLLDKVVRTDDLIEFSSSKLKQRQKKQRGQLLSAVVDEMHGLSPTVPAFSSDVLSWREALVWLMKQDLILDPGKMMDCVYTPLLERSKGTTYEEKIAALQISSKRHQKYETNVIKKRKTKEEDASFYVHMTKQGGTSS
jgi:tRNA pseudouridine38/39 synthase